MHDQLYAGGSESHTLIHFIFTSTDLFVLVLHTGELASVTETCKIVYINDFILAGHRVSADWFSVWSERHEQHA